MATGFTGTIGEKRERVRIEQPVLTSDGQGGHTQSWALLKVVNAEIVPLGYRDALRAAQITSELALAITIWWTQPARLDSTRGISVKDRVRWGSRTLQVESVQNPDGRRVELRLLCSEVQA